MTQPQEKLSLLRTVLKALGLSAEAIDDIVGRILDFLTPVEIKPGPLVIPYAIRDDFLSNAERSFYLVLKHVASGWALVCPKVALGDLFYTKTKDPSLFRTYTNKIDRKHIDFLLCDPKTVQPLLGIELDDKSHQRADRQQRDEFIGRVFEAAHLPLVRVPVRPSYSTTELNALLRQHVQSLALASLPESASPGPSCGPRCPKCGSEMVLRTAKSGANAGGQFWGCPHYPRCKGIAQYALPSGPSGALPNPAKPAP